MTPRSSKSQTGNGDAAYPKEVKALRGLLDTRLAALESAMADPSQHGSLEQIILDLARAATEEADATARHTFLDGQREVQAAVTAARAEAQTAVEAQETAANAVRRELEAARQELVSAQQAIKTEQSAVSSVRRELEQARANVQALERDRAAGATLREELEAAQKAIKDEQSAAASIRRELEQT